MTKNVFRKGLVIGIILLFLGASIVPSISGINENIINNEIVESNHKLSDGYIRVWWKWNETYHPSDCEWNITCFNKIQNAINKASPPCLIRVYNGTYYENIIIKKSSITLEGERPDAVIVDGRGIGSVIKIPHFESGIYSSIKILNITIQNGLPSGIDLMYCELSEVSRCRIQDNTFGIHTWHTNDDNIHNNIITDNFWGILMEFTDHSRLHSNLIDNNRGYGILTDTCDALEIFENEISNNSYGIIPVREVTLLVKNRIVRNNFISNKAHASFKNCKNYWDANYWENPPPTFPILGINVIIGVHEFGSIGISILRFEFDWRCAKKSYEIIPW